MAFGAPFGGIPSDLYVVPTWDVGFLKRGSTVLEVWMVDCTLVSVVAFCPGVDPHPKYTL